MNTSVRELDRYHILAKKSILKSSMAMPGEPGFAVQPDAAQQQIQDKQGQSDKEKKRPDRFFIGNAFVLATLNCCCIFTSPVGSPVAGESSVGNSPNTASNELPSSDVLSGLGSTTSPLYVTR